MKNTFLLLTSVFFIYSFQSAYATASPSCKRFYTPFHLLYLTSLDTALPVYSNPWRQMTFEELGIQGTTVTGQKILPQIVPPPTHQQILEYENIRQSQRGFLFSPFYEWNYKTSQSLTMEGHRFKSMGDRYQLTSIPVRILARDVDVKIPFQKGYDFDHLGYYQVFNVVTGRSENIHYRTYAHTVVKGEPDSGHSNLIKRALFLRPDGDKYKSMDSKKLEVLIQNIRKGLVPGIVDQKVLLQAENEVINYGKQAQRQTLKRLMVFTLQNYGRRDWHIDKETGNQISLDEVTLGKLFDHVYDNFDRYQRIQENFKKKKKSLPFMYSLIFKAIQSFPHTVYHEVLISKENGRGLETVAVIGLTKAPYGYVELFNTTSQKTERHYGPFGSTFDKNHFLDFNGVTFRHHADNHLNVVDSFFMDQIGDLRSPTKNPRRLVKTTGFGLLWDQAVPTLPMEDYLGITLNRPGVIDVSRPILPVDLPQERYQRKIQGPYPNGVVPDFSRPILFYSGEISEPTKFSIKKGIDESIKKKISSELYKLLIESVYEIRDDFDCKCVDLNRNGQRLYTYNPEREVVLYLRMGFKVMADKPIVERNGIRWVPIEATPDVLLNYANGKTTSEDKKRFFESLETSFSDDLSFIDR